jgi:DNA-binding transcriptional ArsR family regulator
VVCFGAGRNVGTLTGAALLLDPGHVERRFRNTIAEVASLIGDAARANMMSALMGRQVLEAGELARNAGVTAQTASGHLAKMTEAQLIVVEKQGRHRYYRLATPDVAFGYRRAQGRA